MIAAYYSYSESKISVFNGKKITEDKEWNEYLGKFNVIKLNMIKYFEKGVDIKIGIGKIKSSIITDVKKRVPNFSCSNESEMNEIIKNIYEKTKREIVLIIDEWDYILRNDKNINSQIKYIEFLTKFIKDNSNIALTYMTGILPLKTSGVSSNLKGAFKEYSMTEPDIMAEYVGFTDEEVKHLCKIYLENKSNGKKNNITYNDIKYWYDGYKMVNPKTKKKYDIYTPYSVISAIENNDIKNYWNKSETFTELSNQINMNFEGLKEDIALLMNNRENNIRINISKYKNDIEYFETKDEILTNLVHLGYLAYDSEKKSVYIPNNEVNENFNNCTDNNADYTLLQKIIRNSKKLLKATWDMEEDVVAKALEKCHNLVNNKVYNNEPALGFSIQYAYIYANVYYTLFPEIDSGKGYADFIFIPYNREVCPAMVVELKYKKKVNTAIDQIKAMDYPDRLEGYKDNILLVCINYDNELKSNNKNYKHHTCKIEKHKHKD